MLRKQIATAIRGSVGLFELDRSRALNDITTAMVDVMARELIALFAAEEWTSLGACLRHELEGARAIPRHLNIVEAVRAVLVDKPRDPAWVARQARTPP